MDPTSVPRQRQGSSTRRYVILFGLALGGGLILLVLGVAIVTLLILPSLPVERSITIILDGQTRSLTTHARTVSELLSEQHIRLGDGDTVSPALTIAGD